jgi:hypothetical protein
LKATVSSVNSKAIKPMLALLTDLRRKMALKHLLLLEELEEEDAGMEEKQLDSKELVKIVENKVTRRAAAGRRKK